MPPYMVSVLKEADTVPADKREDFLRTVEAIARMYEKRGLKKFFQTFLTIRANCCIIQTQGQGAHKNENA